MKGKYDTLRVEEKPGDLLLATLSRPEVANAFNTRAALELCEFFESLEAGGRCRGLELVLLCDFAYASKSARFALTEASLGIMPGGGGTQTLARAVGERRAKELILAARPFSAEEALAWGVVNGLCEPPSLLDATLEAAARIAANAPLAVREARRAIREGLGMDLASAMQLEIAAYNRLVATEDRKEGVRAFNEKRKPKFKGR